MSPETQPDRISHGRKRKRPTLHLTVSDSEFHTNHFEIIKPILPQNKRLLLKSGCTILIVRCKPNFNLQRKQNHPAFRLRKVNINFEWPVRSSSLISELNCLHIIYRIAFITKVQSEQHCEIWIYYRPVYRNNDLVFIGRRHFKTYSNKKERFISYRK